MSPRFQPSSRPIPTMPLDRCIAKRSEQTEASMTVLDHMRLVGHVAKRLLERMPQAVREVFPPGIVTLAAAHDLGKLSPGFQKRIMGAALSTVCPQLVGLGGFEENHCAVGEASLSAWYHEHAPRAKDWGQLAGYHHGDRSAPNRPDNETYGGPDWEKLRQKVLAQLVDEFGPLPTDPPPKQFLAATGLVCVADWIASDENLFPLDRPLDDHLAQIEHVLDDLGFVWINPRPGLSFEDLFGFSANEMQDAVGRLADRPGLLLIEAPMGSGKTEAALWTAYRLMTQGHNHGMYFALPTRLSSNLIYQRVQDFLGRAFEGDGRARLIHAHAWLYEHLEKLFAGGEEFRPGRQWFAPTKRGILWPFGVGTVDQALLGVLCVKHFFLRLFGLAGKVVILDEIHSYDLYTGTLVDALVQTLLELRATVIILTGTLTHTRRQSLGISLSADYAQAYPLVVKTGEKPVLPPAPEVSYKQVRLRRICDDLDTLADEVTPLLQQGAAIVIVCNTVRKAQDVFRHLKSALPQDVAQLGLLHSLFLPWHRAELESRWTRRLGKSSTNRGPSLLVATQVVEQSVDLDADLLITELAPTDMLLQRLGRLWRHRRDSRPLPHAECWLIDYDCLAANDRADFLERLRGFRRIYAPYVLWRTARTLAPRKSIVFPDQVRELLERTYVELQPDDPPWVNELLAELRERQATLRNLAITAQDKNLPALKDDEDVATRYSDKENKPLLIVADIRPRGNGMEIKLVGREEPVFWQPRGANVALAAQLHLNTTSVPSYFLADLPRESAPDWVCFTVGSDVQVLRRNRAGSLSTLAGQPTPLVYSLELGLYRQQEDGSPSDEEF